MSKNDLRIRDEIENILIHPAYGNKLKEYLQQVPNEQCRRVLYILSAVYPRRLKVDKNDYILIEYILTQNKFLEVETICNFIQSINVLELNDEQKLALANIVQMHMEILSKSCMFELSEFITKILTKNELLEYIEEYILDTNCHTSVVRLFDSTIRYEAYFKNDTSSRLKELKQRISDRIEKG